MEQTHHKYYQFKFSLSMILLLILAIVLCVAGFGVTIWRMVVAGTGSAWQWIQYILLFVISFSLAGIAVSMLVCSRYIVTDKEVILQFGIIKQRYKIEKIRYIHLFQGAKKLAVYFDDARCKQIMIVIKEELYDDFTKTLLKRNDHTGFSFSTAEEENTAKKKK